MTNNERERAQPLFLGIEGGGTRTVSLLATTDDRLMGKSISGPTNLRLVSDAQLLKRFRSVHNHQFSPAAVAIGLAGTRTESDRRRIRRAAAKVWPGVPCYATNDLEAALMAAENTEVERWKPESANRAAGRQPPNSELTRVLVLSGTGSCCFGRTPDGKTVSVGGWGHILGDKGSGFEIGLRALKAVVYYYDRDGKWPKLGRRIVRKLQLNEPDDLIGWAQTAGKKDVALVAVEVFDAWSVGDKIAADILEGAAHSLAEDAIHCARRITSQKARVDFVLAGGVLLRQPRFAKMVAALLRKSWPKATVMPLNRESVWGTVHLAKKLFREQTGAGPFPPIATREASFPSENRLGVSPLTSNLPSLESLKLSPTEQRNPRSLNLDKLSIPEAILLMLNEDKRIPMAILAERERIGEAVRLVVSAFKRGGRLFYVGAGTSGRLGVLDASECPPTFRTPPDLVQGIIAGGQHALWEAVEGAEDDPSAGARAIQFRGVNRRDVVTGIAASGRTPFVWGALWEAQKRGAKTILLSFNPFVEIARSKRPDLVIAANVGPEILTGSTRLKAGTATKLILNIITTLAMVRTGKVISNLMTDVNPSNLKLCYRAVRMVSQLAGVDDIQAKAALEETGWVVKGAWKRVKHSRRKQSPEQTRR